MGRVAVRKEALFLYPDILLRGSFFFASILKEAVAVVEVALFVISAAFVAKFTYPAAVALFAMTSDRTLYRKFAALPTFVAGFSWHWETALATSFSLP